MHVVLVSLIKALSFALLHGHVLARAVAATLDQALGERSVFQGCRYRQEVVVHLQIPNKFDSIIKLRIIPIKLNNYAEHLKTSCQKSKFSA